MRSEFLQYTTDYISKVMSLRIPQEKSLEALDKILKTVDFKKGADLAENLKKINAFFPACTSFEHDFISLAFALATGVGKTRLMGAFIAYLYTNYGIKNFFVVAPGITIAEKLISDFKDQANEKYVFKGLSCLCGNVNVISGDDYKKGTASLFKDMANIFVFNISKFNKETNSMREISEYFGRSFLDELASVGDLVVLSDESHHYRAEKSFDAINKLNPLLSIEVTATPYYTTKTQKQKYFENVVFQYPLSKAIKDGYTRTPFAVTRADIKSYNFGDDEMDKMMVKDGILLHKKAKENLLNYAKLNNKRVVKPFMLVVCKDTEHAEKIKTYITSSNFENGYYKDKTIVVHSKQKSEESEENTRLLLDVEKANNRIEIVIHVNMLKEGWDVNNLYTIVPLRTATSKILREQMIGRGLRLPYGERTGDKDVDGVKLTAHDKFDEIIEEARRGDSIFCSESLIKIEDVEKEKHIIQTPSLPIYYDDEPKVIDGLEDNSANREFSKEIVETISDAVYDVILTSKSNSFETNNDFAKTFANVLSQKVSKKIESDVDFGKRYEENYDLTNVFIQKETPQIYKEIASKFIPIPQLKITEKGCENYSFKDFELNVNRINFAPIENKMLIKKLIESGFITELDAEKLDFDALNPAVEILKELRKKPEIDYEKSPELIQKLIKKTLFHIKSKYNSENDVKNIVMMNRNDIANIIYEQMMDNFTSDNTLFEDEVMSVNFVNKKQKYTCDFECGLYDNFSDSYKGSIKSILFKGAKKAPFNECKFDSKEEWILSHVLENDKDVLKWLRPAKDEFNIYYQNYRRYEPDFVVETADNVYIVEVKGENMLENEDVLAKKNRAISYCKVVTAWSTPKNFKSWKYVFIPSNEIKESSTFMNLVKRFVEG